MLWRQCGEVLWREPTVPSVTGLRRSDLPWLLLTPAYVVIATARHELAHAAVAVTQGARIVDWSILPGSVDGTFYFGYVLWEGGAVTWLATAAPYIADLVTTGIGIGLLPRAERHWVWINVWILAIFSSLVNSGYQYGRTLILGGGDVGVLLMDQPALAVHAWFLVTMVLYGAVAFSVARGETGPRTLADEITR